MKIEAHRCDYPGCGKIAIAVDGRRLTEHRHPGENDIWTVVESIRFYTDQLPTLAGVIGSAFAETLRPYLEKVAAEDAAYKKVKTRMRASHLKVVRSEDKPPRKR
jgi:hypothetical protein